MLHYMITCYMCLGFWSGLFWYACGAFPELDYSLQWLSAGMIASATTWFARVVLAKLKEDDL